MREDLLIGSTGWLDAGISGMKSSEIDGGMEIKERCMDVRCILDFLFDVVFIVFIVNKIFLNILYHQGSREIRSTTISVQRLFARKICSVMYTIYVESV